ncbi:MAG: PTS fructose transporter subunit EIIBC, partial [Pseudomonas sp.]
NSVIEAALATEEIYKSDQGVKTSSAATNSAGKKSGPYQHLLTGVSYMLPLVVAGGLLIALSFVFGIDAFKTAGTLPAALMQIGGGAAFKLIVPILAGFIAYSIADRPGLTPGLVGGWLAAEMGSGFLGGIIAGFIAGYVARFIRDKTPLPASMQGLMPILIIPLFSTLITGLLMIYVVGAPMKSIMDGLTSALLGLSGTNAILLGAILGAMMAFDLGGPTNKAAYAFTAGLLSSNTFGPMAATMAGGMVPPLGVALACFIARGKFSPEERRAGKTAGILGLCFISEAAIPFAARDPLRVIPCNVVGAALTGALSMYFGCGIRVPHGGVFIFGIPNAVENLPMYCLSILLGTLVTG